MDRSTATHFGAKVSNYSVFATTQHSIAKDLSEQTVNQMPTLNGYWLDIGCGPAVVSSYLFDHQKNVTPILLDLSIRTLSQVDISQNPICANMEALPFLSNQFTGITASSSLQWASSMETTIADFHRILKKSGILSIAAFTENSLKELTQTQSAFNIPIPVQYPSEKTIKTLLEKNGFQILQQQSKSYSESYDTGFDAIRAISRIGAGFHSGTPFTPSGLRRFVSYYESLFSGSIVNRYSVTIITALRD